MKCCIEAKRGVLRKNEIAIWRRTERDRAMCGVIDRNNTKELMDMLGLQNTVVSWQEQMRYVGMGCIEKRWR